MSNKSSLLAAVALGLVAGAVQAEPGLPVYNQGALARAFALPVLGTPAVLAAGDGRDALRYDLTSEYHASASGSEAVILDGEADLLTLAFRRGLGHGLEASLSLPLLHQSGGFMDGSIENWHSWFGLPNGGRELAPRDRYLYQYTRNGETRLDATRTGTDLGDLRVGLGWQALDGLALRGELKLPTGDDAHLAGGNTGAAVWADWALPFPSGLPLSGWLSGGVSVNDRAAPLHGQQNTVIPVGGAGLGLRITERVSLLAQLYAHGALFGGSGLDPFREALQFALGLRWRTSPDFAFDLGFQEDPITSSSPDFSLHLGFSWRP